MYDSSKEQTQIMEEVNKFTYKHRMAIEGRYNKEQIKSSTEHTS